MKRRKEKLLKAIITGLFLISLILAPASPQLIAAGPASALQTQKDKESYSIGYEVGRSMKTDGVDVDFNVLTQGLEDAINQKEPRLKDEEMRKLIVDLRKRPVKPSRERFKSKLSRTRRSPSSSWRRTKRRRASRLPKAASSTGS